MKQILLFLLMLFYIKTLSQTGIEYEDLYHKNDINLLSHKKSNINLVSYSLCCDTNFVISSNIQSLLRNKNKHLILSVFTKNDTSYIYAMSESFWNIIDTYSDNLIGVCHIIQKEQEKDLLIACDENAISRKIISTLFIQNSNTIQYLRKIKIIPDSIYLIKHHTPIGFTTILKNDTIIFNQTYIK